MAIITCWCGVKATEGAMHYPAGDPENGPAHAAKDIVNTTCPGDCEPTCSFCRNVADIAAEERQSNWEDAGYFDVTPFFDPEKRD